MCMQMLHLIIWETFARLRKLVTLWCCQASLYSNCIDPYMRLCSEFIYLSTYSSKLSNTECKLPRLLRLLLLLLLLCVFC